VTFCDAAGLSALLSAHHDFATRSGRLVLCEVPPGVRRVMHLVGLDAVLCGALVPGEAAGDPWIADGSARTRRRRKIAIVDGAATEPGTAML
jgi:hypothetical protein